MLVKPTITTIRKCFKEDEYRNLFEYMGFDAECTDEELEDLADQLGNINYGVVSLVLACLSSITMKTLFPSMNRTGMRLMILSMMFIAPSA